jgi:hypothetical protein
MGSVHTCGQLSYQNIPLVRNGHTTALYSVDRRKISYKPLSSIHQFKVISVNNDSSHFLNLNWFIYYMAYNAIWTIQYCGPSDGPLQMTNGPRITD